MQSETLRADIVNIVKGRNLRYGWPLHQVDWRNLPTDLVKSMSWKSVILGHSEVRSVPSESGVYMMCAKPPLTTSESAPFGLLYEAIYVGESINLKRRFREHLNTPSNKVNEARKCYPASLTFWYHLADSQQIKQIESLMIQCLGPPANDKPGIDPGSAVASTSKPAGSAVYQGVSQNA